MGFYCKTDSETLFKTVVILKRLEIMNLFVQDRTGSSHDNGIGNPTRKSGYFFLEPRTVLEVETNFEPVDRG